MINANVTKLAQAFVKFLLTLPGPRSFPLLTQILERVPRLVKDSLKDIQFSLKQDKSPHLAKPKKNHL